MSEYHQTRRGAAAIFLAVLLVNFPARGQGQSDPRILLKCNVIDSKMVEVLEIDTEALGRIKLHWRTSSTDHEGTADKRYVTFQNRPITGGEAIKNFTWKIDRHSGAMARDNSGTIEALCTQVDKPLIGK